MKANEVLKAEMWAVVRSNKDGSKTQIQIVEGALMADLLAESLEDQTGLEHRVEFPQPHRRLRNSEANE